MNSNHAVAQRLFLNWLGGRITSPRVRKDLGLRTRNNSQTDLRPSNSSGFVRISDQSGSGPYDLHKTVGLHRQGC